VTAEKAAKLAESAGSEALARKIRSRLELFKQEQAYIEEPTGPRGRNN
jgi:hypothetical protein